MLTLILLTFSDIKVFFSLNIFFLFYQTVLKCQKYIKVSQQNSKVNMLNFKLEEIHIIMKKFISLRHWLPALHGRWPLLRLVTLLSKQAEDLPSFFRLVVAPHPPVNVVTWGLWRQRGQPPPLAFSYDLPISLADATRACAGWPRPFTVCALIQITEPARFQCLTLQSVTLARVRKPSRDGCLCTIYGHWPLYRVVFAQL
jgi:hypothetical protein